MPTFKTVLVYNQFQQGWTETYYREAATAKLAANFPPAVLANIMAIKHPSVVLTGIRASNILIKRSTYFRTYNRNGTGPVAEGQEYEDVTSTACLMRALTPSPSVKGTDYLRGLCDSDVVRSPVSGVSVPSARLEGLLNGLETKIIDGNNGFQFVAPYTPQTAGYEWQQIQQVEKDATNDRRSTLIVQGLWPGIAVNQQMTIRGIDQNDLPALKGQFVVLAFDAPTRKIWIGYRYRLSTTPYMPWQAYARRYELAPSNISEYVFQRFGTHKTGRPTLRSVGRRKVQVKRQ